MFCERFDKRVEGQRRLGGGQWVFCPDRTVADGDRRFLGVFGLVEIREDRKVFWEFELGFRIGKGERDRTVLSVSFSGF